MTVARGDIAVVPFPFSDRDGRKLRPALVVSVGAGSLIVAFIGSQAGQLAPPSRVWLLPGDAEFGRTRLKQASLVHLDHLATLDPALIHGRIGRIGPRMQAVIDAALRYVFSLSN
jgi:mRNA interferase MazF